MEEMSDKDGQGRRTAQKLLIRPKRVQNDAENPSGISNKRPNTRSRTLSPATNINWAPVTSLNISLPVANISHSDAIPAIRKSGRTKTRDTVSAAPAVVDLTRSATFTRPPNVAGRPPPAATAVPPTGAHNPGSSCGYCLQEVDCMVDPRAMPCGHFFCLPCLQADNRDISVIKCGICRWNFQSTDILKLPKVPQNPCKAGPSTSQNDIKCDVCDETDKQTAVRFCMDCLKKMCDNHTQLHDDYQTKFGGGKHNSISISDYSDDNLQFSASQHCTKHQKPYTLSCSNCLMMFCEMCDDTDGNCSCEDAANTSSFIKPLITPHRLCQLKKLSGTLVKTLSDYSVKLSMKENDVARLDKAAWNKYDKLEGHVQNMIKTVDDTVQKHVDQVKRLGAELKTTICDYQIANAQAVETYSGDISKRLNTLSTLRSDINNLTKSSDVEIISKYTSTVDSSTELLKTTPGPVILHRKVLSTPLIHQRIPASLGIGLVTPMPSRITLVNKAKAPGGRYYSVKWSNIGLLVGKDGGFEVRSEQAQLRSTHIIEEYTSDVHGVVPLSDGGVVILERDCEDMDYSLSTYTSDLKYDSVFALFDETNTRHSMIAASENRIVVTRSESKKSAKLHVYDHDSNKLATHKLDGMAHPYGVTFLIDGCIAVCDRVNGTVTKYSLQPEFKKQWVWTAYNHGGCQPSGISSDELGFIYVVDHHGGPITVLNSERGQRVYVLDSPLINTEGPGTKIYDVDVRDDKLALACGKGGVKVFEIQR